MLCKNKDIDTEFWLRIWPPDGELGIFFSAFLAHLRPELKAIGELIVYPCSGVHRSSVCHPQFQRSSPLKPLGQTKPNFMWSILRKGERKFVSMIQILDLFYDKVNLGR